MAAALFRKHLAAKLGVPVSDLARLGYRIRSAGVFAAVGNLAADNAVLVMEEMGCDISDHRTQPLTEELANEADRIFALSTSHFQLAIQLFPWTAEKLSMIGDGVTDPIGGDLETYRNCANEIDLALRKIVQSF
jgi:protein-tyrosine-phosphatase